MAVKNTETRNYDVEYDTLCNLFRNQDFSKCIDADYIEEAIIRNYIEFRYVRKTNISRYGRNFFIKVEKADEDITSVSVTTQSRKVTVLFDTSWKKEVTKVFDMIDILLKNKSN